jgi:hypothetical protein
MPTAYTPLLGLALPVQGELSNTWGDVVNNSITSLVEDSVANFATASVTSADWTLTTTGSGLSNQARMAILIPTGTPGVSRNIIAPSYSKTYYIVNQSNAVVVIKGSATTGVSVPAGRVALVVWNGSDFVSAADPIIDLTDQVTGVLPVANGGTGAATLTGLVVGNGTSPMSVVTAPTGAVVGTTDTQTLTNKRVTPRVVSITSNTVTINADTTDQYNAQVVGGFITVNAPTGTPTDGQKLILRVLDSGTSGTFLWNAIWRVVGTVLPFATSVNKVTYVGAVYNASAVKWDVIGVVTQS